MSLHHVRAAAADALLARETDRRADALTGRLAAFHDARVRQQLVAYRRAWEAHHGRPDAHGESTAEVIGEYLTHAAAVTLI